MSTEEPKIEEVPATAAAGEEKPAAVKEMDADEKEIEQKMVKTILGMPKEVQRRFKVLHMLSDMRSKLNDEFNEACKKLEKQCDERKKPFLDQRANIISGEMTDFGELPARFDKSHTETEEKVEKFKPEEKPEDEAVEEEKVPTDTSYLKGQAGIPDFWHRAMQSNKLIWDQVREKDEPIMKHLKHVEMKNDPESKNMIVTLNMVFAEDNDFFKPSTLSVSCVYDDSEQSVSKIAGTNIEWLEGKDPTKKKIKKKQKHKKSGETRTVVKTVEAESFFNIFKDREAPAEASDAKDSEEENDIRDKIDEVQQTVEDFNDLLVPDALQYYLNLNEDFDMLGMDGEGDESDMGDDDDSEGDAKPPPPKKGKKGKGGEAAGAEDQKDCKQQ